MGYAKEIPSDKNNHVYRTNTQPAVVSTQAWSSVFTVSSIVGLDPDSTVVQLTAISQPAQFKWVSTTASVLSSITGTLFDGIVPANDTRTIVIPQSVAGAQGSVAAGLSNGLYTGIAIKQTAIGGSVFGVEF